MHGPTCIFWANLTPFSLEVAAEAAAEVEAEAAAKAERAAGLQFVGGLAAVRGRRHSAPRESS